jgi:endo-1,4-beta-xylanase
MRAKVHFSGVAILLALAACGGGGPVASSQTGGAATTTSSGGQQSSGGVGAGGTTSTGGTKASGGTTGNGGTSVTGGTGSGGSTSTGGTISSGGQTATGGVTATSTGGTRATGGSGPGTGGTTGTPTGGTRAAGGSGPGTGGTTSPSTGTSVIDCSAAMPSGGTDHCGQNTQGTAGGLTWSLWCNSLSSTACITTYSTSAFSARWNNNSDFLARIGLEFGSAGKTYDQYGTIKADFAYKKTGSGGGYSYIGIYGWSTNPCVEWYIVDDRFGTMPFNAYNATQKGTGQIDGETYKFFQNKTNGTGGSRCSGVSQWDQYWSIRQTARQCGTITISDHFKAWDTAGLKLGGLLEAKILVETGGGTGSIDFPVATVTKSQ